MSRIYISLSMIITALLSYSLRAQEAKPQGLPNPFYGVVQSGVTLAGTRDHDREAVSPVLCGSYKRKRPHCRREKC
ncbi:MAG: hypothetical protein ABSH20_17395, partial [Tepidisphaeraceae bacterium]